MSAAATDAGHSTDLIRQVPIFAELSEAEASELWHAGQRVNVAPGEVFIREGEQGGSLYIILAGAVEVTKEDGGHEVTLATRGPGEFLGEMSLLEQAPRTASVRATEPSELLAIGSEAFRQLLAR
ncbi:MAG: crp 2, partial [Devosia sp.]|nr:crp 2 [Devosia sp.]